MKTYNTKPPGLMKLVAMAFIGFVATTVLVQGTAFATTAASTTITNQATVNYDDSAGNPQGAINASVVVIVNLLEATPTLSAPTDDSVFSGSAVDYTYDITANANGVDTYDLTSAQTGATGTITGNTMVFRDIGDTTDITSIDLGATSVAVAAAGGATAITVPSDGASDASINGIESGDTLFIGATTYTVSSITDNATGTSTINLSAGLAAGVSVGDQIGEQAQFIFRVTPSTTVDGSTVTNQVDARDDAAAQAAAQDSTTTTVNIAPSITVTKYVRNVGPCHGTLSDCNPAAGAVTINGEDYWATGVTGDPGDTLEYVIAVANANNAGTALDVIISDPIPTYTTYAGSMQVDATGNGWDAPAIDDSLNNGDAGEYDAGAGTNGIVYIYAGTGGSDTNVVGPPAATGTGGSLAGNVTTYGSFQVTIDN